MSYDEEPDYHEPPPRRQRDVRYYREPRASGGGGLFSGLLITALIAGGAYYAWTKVDPAQSPQQITDSRPAPSVSAPVYEADDNARFATAAPETQADIAEAPVKQAEPEPPPVRTAENTAPANPAALPAPFTFLRGAPAPPRPAAAPPAAPGSQRLAAAEIAQGTIGVGAITQSDEVIVNARRPIWRYAPRAERLAEYYPASALDRGREGEASLHCIIGEKGALDCERVSEYPERAGFGLAALKVARTLRHAEQRADGRSAIGTPIDLRVVFRMPEGERREGRSRS